MRRRELNSRSAAAHCCCSLARVAGPRRCAPRASAALAKHRHCEAAKLLQQTLGEEKAADKKLSGLAEGGINQGAADAAHAEGDGEPVGAGARRNLAKSGGR
jgi:hypothetical protein